MAKTKFTMADEVRDHSIEFSSEVDEDGDFVFYANGVMLAFVCSVDGKLHICECVDPIEGLDISGDNDSLAVVQE